MASPEDAKVAAGIAGTGAERLLGRGDFLVVTKGQARRFQAAYITRSELAEAVARIDGEGSGLELPKPGLRDQVRELLHIIDGRGGHNRKPPTEAMVEFALWVKRTTGGWPSKRAIRANYSCNNRRATDTLAVAMERWNGKTASHVGASGL